MTVHDEGDMPLTMEDLKHGVQRMRSAAPETWGGLGTVRRRSAEAPSALDPKTKELIALGMSITAQCKYCVGTHTQRCLDSGATEAEIVDVCHVAMAMGGRACDDIHGSRGSQGAGGVRRETRAIDLKAPDCRVSVKGTFYFSAVAEK